MNKDLIFNEFEEEMALKRLYKERNDQLEQLDGCYRYGTMENGIEFFWGIRFGKLVRINRTTRRQFKERNQCLNHGKLNQVRHSYYSSQSTVWELRARVTRTVAYITN